MSGGVAHACMRIPHLQPLPRWGLALTAAGAARRAGNLTWELVAWNATDGPTANQTTQFSVARLGSQAVLTQDLQQLLRDNNLDPATLPNYFLHLYVRAPAARRAAPALGGRLMK